MQFAKNYSQLLSQIVEMTEEFVVGSENVVVMLHHDADEATDPELAERYRQMAFDMEQTQRRLDQLLQESDVLHESHSQKEDDIRRLQVCLIFSSINILPERE